MVGGIFSVFGAADDARRVGRANRTILRTTLPNCRCSGPLL